MFFILDNLTATLAIIHGRLLSFIKSVVAKKRGERMSRVMLLSEDMQPPPSTSIAFVLANACGLSPSNLQAKRESNSVDAEMFSLFPLGDRLKDHMLHAECAPTARSFS